MYSVKMDKCVTGCGDLRNINFIRMGLQFASERFFRWYTHTHTNIDTQTHTRSLHEVINPASGVTNLASDVTNPDSDVTISPTTMNFSTKVTNFAFFVTNLSPHES